MDKPQNALNERQAGGGEERHKAEEGDRCASTVVTSKGPKTSSLIAGLSFDPGLWRRHRAIPPTATVFYSPRWLIYVIAYCAIPCPQS